MMKSYALLLFLTVTLSFHAEAASKAKMGRKPNSQQSLSKEVVADLISHPRVAPCLKELYKLREKIGGRVQSIEQSPQG